MKSKITKKWMVLAILMSPFILSNCGGKNLEVSRISSTENPTQQISALSADVTKAMNEKVNVLSPDWFAKADNSLKKAQQMQKSGESLDKMFKSVASGKAELKKANEMAQVSRTALPTAIKAREDARAAGATTFEQDYGNTEVEFRRLTRAIENNNLGWAQKNEKHVTNSFRGLELRAIKEKAIGEARTTIREAESKGARKIVPQSYTMAEKKLKEADAFISQNRYNKDDMLRKANEARFYANRLKYLHGQSLALQKKSPEQTSLWVEGMLHSISKKLSAPDMRNQAFTTQVDNINGTVGSLQKDQQFLADKVKAQETQITGFHDQVASLEGLSKKEQNAKEQLEAEKRFNQLYGEVRTYFDSGEAEVYKEGEQLLIRLKTMQFPIGKSVIMPNNYPLLSKVQKAIRTFGEPKVIIEGHTDSTGSSAMNEHLSHQRAEAVKSYLVANQTLLEDKLVAVGYGPTKPVAANTTSKGRAMNRRIDVVISPEAIVTK